MLFLTKAEQAVVTWLYQNVPTKTTKFLHKYKVQFFTGKSAIEKLLNDSPYAKKNVKDPETQLYFEDHDQCKDFMNRLLMHKMFHRAEKIRVTDGKCCDVKHMEHWKKKHSKAATEDESDLNHQKSSKAGVLKKKKICLDMHLEQVFLDTEDVYVWIYASEPKHYWMIGAVIILTLICLLMVPLWPVRIKRGVNYFSMVVGILWAGTILLEILKYFIFALLLKLNELNEKQHIIFRSSSSN